MIDLELWKQRKKELRLNYALIAEKAKVSKRSVEDIFRGYTENPRIDTVRAIEGALGLGFTPEEEAAGISPTARVTITPDEDDLLTIYREIGEKKGAEAQELARRLLEQIRNS